MSTSTFAQLVDKYHDIIAEEVNVKEVTLLPESQTVTVTYIPLGQQLSSKFGKDTGHIIAAAKQGKVTLLEQGQIRVSQGDSSRILDRSDYEIRYQGVDESHQTVEEGIIISLDMTMNEALLAEGVAREISRFLNQLRKDANYQVDERVVCLRTSDSPHLVRVLESFHDFLVGEALLQTLAQDSAPAGDIVKGFESEEGTITFALHRSGK